MNNLSINDDYFNFSNSLSALASLSFWPSSFEIIFLPNGTKATGTILKWAIILGIATIVQIKKTFKIPASICAKAIIHPNVITQITLPKTLTTGDAFSKFVSSSFCSLNDFKYFVDTISLPKGKKLYLIAGHKNGKRGNNIIPPKKYNNGT